MATMNDAHRRKTSVIGPWPNPEAIDRNQPGRGRDLAGRSETKRWASGRRPPFPGNQVFTSDGFHPSPRAERPRNCMNAPTSMPSTANCPQSQSQPRRKLHRPQQSTPPSIGGHCGPLPARQLPTTRGPYLTAAFRDDMIIQMCRITRIRL